jgi:hypothetical protein
MVDPPQQQSVHALDACMTTAEQREGLVKTSGWRIGVQRGRDFKKAWGRPWPHS